MQDQGGGVRYDCRDHAVIEKWVCKLSGSQLLLSKNTRVREGE